METKDRNNELWRAEHTMLRHLQELDVGAIKVMEAHAKGAHPSSPKAHVFILRVDSVQDAIKAITCDIGQWQMSARIMADLVEKLGVAWLFVEMAERPQVNHTLIAREETSATLFTGGIVQPNQARYYDDSEGFRVEIACHPDCGNFNVNAGSYRDYGWIFCEDCKEYYRP